jgi:plastocyanin
MDPEEKTMRDRLTPKRKIPALALIVAASVGLPACGDDDEDKQAAAAPKKVAVTATETGKQSRLSVPKSVPAGLVTVELTNTGKAFHEAQLIRLDAGHTPEEALNVIAAEGAPSPGWIQAAGGTGPAPPGGSSSATQRLRPGNYVAYDAPFKNEGQGLRVGLATFKVEGEASDDGLPEGTAKIEAYEYGFRVSGLKAGQNTIEFSNTGSEPHHVVAAPYRPGATLAKVRKAFKREQGGAEPPLDFENSFSTARIQGGTKQLTELDLDKPGKYALLCFVSDRKGGPPHVAQGMIAETTVR